MTGRNASTVTFGHPDPGCMQVIVEVLRSEFKGNVARYGVRFVDLAREARDQIERYVQRLRSRELI